jgi:hypothetical protein
MVSILFSAHDGSRRRDASNSSAKDSDRTRLDYADDDQRLSQMIDDLPVVDHLARSKSKVVDLKSTRLHVKILSTKKLSEDILFSLFGFVMIHSMV